MTLRNVYIVGGEGIKDIQLNNGIIQAVTDSSQPSVNQLKDTVIELDNALAFPGLINSHDHLDFNLFPPLGNRIYNNYTEWGNDIHANNKVTIDAVLKIPHGLRVQWGMYKNLLNGVTTVINHGKKLFIENEFITVFQDCHTLHSIAFEKNWKYKLNRLFNGQKPYVVHIGEGTGAPAQEEINTLIKWNFFKRKIIGIHAVAMNQKQAGYFKAIVWCPVSNIFLLNATASIDKLKNKTSIIFGTDATLTAGWNIWEHLRMARSTQMLSDQELFAAVTETAADVWGLNAGKLTTNSSADIIVATKNEAPKNMDAFYLLNPEDILLVIKTGTIVLFDESLLQQLSNKQLISGSFSKVIIAGKKKLVAGDLPALATAIKKHHPGIQFPFA